MWKSDHKVQKPPGLNLQAPIYSGPLIEMTVSKIREYLCFRQVAIAYIQKGITETLTFDETRNPSSRNPNTVLCFYVMECYGADVFHL